MTGITPYLVSSRHTTTNPNSYTNFNQVPPNVGEIYYKDVNSPGLVLVDSNGKPIDPQHSQLVPDWQPAYFEVHGEWYRIKDHGGLERLDGPPPEAEHQQLLSNTAYNALQASGAQEQIAANRLTTTINRIALDIQTKDGKPTIEDARLWAVKDILGASQGESDESIISRGNAALNTNSPDYNSDIATAITLRETQYWAVSQGASTNEEVDKGVLYKLKLNDIVHNPPETIGSIKSRTEFVREKIRAAHPQDTYRPVRESGPATFSGGSPDRLITYDQFVYQETRNALNAKTYDTAYYDQFIDFAKNNREALGFLKGEEIRLANNLSLKDFNSNVEGVQKIEVNWILKKATYQPAGGYSIQTSPGISGQKDAYVFKAEDGQHYVAFQDDNGHGAVKKISEEAYRSAFVRNGDTGELIKTISRGVEGSIQHLSGASTTEKTMADVVSKQQWDITEKNLNTLKSQNYDPTGLQQFAQIIVPFYDVIHNALYDNNPPPVDGASVLLDVTDVLITLATAGIPIAKGASAAAKALKAAGKGLSRAAKINTAVQALAKPLGKAGVELLDGVIPLPTITQALKGIVKGAGKGVDQLIEAARKAVDDGDLPTAAKPSRPHVNSLGAVEPPPPPPKESFIDRINRIRSIGLSGDPITAAEFLKNGKRSDVIAQNANQSGDSNGVAVALLTSEKNKLLFMTSPSDTKGHDTLRYYHSMGVPKEQIQIINVTKGKSLPEEFADIGGITDLKLKTGQSAEPNQVYQNIAGSRTQSQQELFFSRFENYDGPEGVKSFLEKNKLDKPSEVGHSTKQVTQNIKGGDPMATKDFFDRNWKAYENPTSLTVARREAINKQVDDVYKAILEKVGPGKEFEGISLVWSRGLNKSEYDSVFEAGQKLKKKNTQVTDEDVQETKAFKTLNALKRNPHHLMTPQLYETLRTVNNNKKMLTIPIGDPIEFAPYSRALKGEERSYYLNNSDDPLNLIQYWNRPDAPQGRYEQGVFLQQLFKKLNETGEGIPMQQVGLRSGEMEKGAYMGIPTLYLEENNAFSGGARLLPLTTGGQKVQDAEHAFSDLSKKTIEAWENIQTLEKSLKSMDSRLRGMKKATNPSPALEKRMADVENKIKELKIEIQKNEEIFNQGAKQISESQLNATLFGQTDWAWAATQGGESGGLPHFMRENLDNLVGMNAAKSQGDVDLVKQWLNEKLKGTPDSELPQLPPGLSQGTMNSLEIDMLGEFLENLKVNYPSYKESYLPS